MRPTESEHQRKIRDLEFNVRIARHNLQFHKDQMVSLHRDVVKWELKLELLRAKVFE